MKCDPHILDADVYALCINENRETEIFKAVEYGDEVKFAELLSAAEAAHKLSGAPADEWAQWYAEFMLGELHKHEAVVFGNGVVPPMVVGYSHR